MKVSTIITVAFLTTLISLEVEATNDSLINQLPSECSNLDILANQPYKILPCFATTLGNNRTNQSAIRDAYRQFHALNWPVKTGTIGQADFDANYTSLRDTYPVWQSWPTTAEVESNLHNNWNETHIVLPESCRTAPSIQNFIKSKQLEDPAHWGEPLVLKQFRNPQGHILTDRNGQKTFYTVHLNKPAFDYLKSLKNSEINRFDYPEGMDNENEARGAIFAKAAWRKITSTETKVYHSAIAYILEPNESGVTNCSMSIVGLSGLHITSKNNPKNVNPSEKTSTTNKWSWATYIFEGSVPHFSLNKNGSYTIEKKDILLRKNNLWGYFSMNSEEISNLCTTDSELDYTKSSCPINTPQCKTLGITCPPDQIVAYPILQDQENLDSYNTETKKRLRNSVWGNYNIINNQWSDNGIPSPKVLANPILEPFHGPKSSCSACHQEANKAIFKDYIFNPGIRADIKSLIKE